MGNIAIFIGLIALAAYGNAASVFKSDVSFSVHSFKFNNAASLQSGYTKLFFSLSFDIVNPSAFSTTVKTLSLAVYHSGNKIATTGTSAPFKLKPNGATSLTLPVMITTSNALKDIPSFATDILDGSAELRVKGTADIGFGKVYIDQSKIISIA